MPIIVVTGPSLVRQYSGTYVAAAEYYGVGTFGSIGTYRFENEHGSHLYCDANLSADGAPQVKWILASKGALIVDENGDDFDLTLTAAKIQSDVPLGTRFWDDCTDGRSLPPSAFAQGGSNEITLTLARYVDTVPCQA